MNVPRRVLILVAGLALFAACPLVASANYYGIAKLQSNSNFRGTDMEIKSHKLYIPDPSYDFVNNDSWVVSGSYWIEAGLIHGTFCCTHYAGAVSFFWADSRPNGGGFHSHLGPTASLSTYYDDNIYYAGSGDWGVDVGGFTGTSTNTFTVANVIETGTETSYTGAEACASQNYLEWRDANLVLHSGWHDTHYGDATLAQDKPPYAYWVSKPSHLKDYINYSC